ncbi:hypothetical protein [Yeguia hominis]|uniref:Uncharacterized protein n=1 Tax=Yeguia hominis TaxID=2763662 RepID=A0A926D7Z6_9FIRM|nr:hypothetical protein [Yeguia hominis]MBC8533371.1 hypothetical protein [Yeguia hominis]
MQIKELMLKILLFLFALILILSLVGMAFGPFGYEKISVAFSAAAIVLSVCGLIAALHFWGKDA